MKRIRSLLFPMLLFIGVFATLYHYFYAPYTLHFDMKKLKASHGMAYGQVYYSPTNAYTPHRMYAFLHWWGFHNRFQHFTVPIKADRLNAIRLDPLSDAGEVILRNVYITEGSWWNRHIHLINLTAINKHTLRHIDILDLKPDAAHLVATGKDPHLEIATHLNLFNPVIDTKQLLILALIAALIAGVLYATLRGWRKGRLRLEEMLTVLMLLAYSTYTVLFGTQFKMAWLLITYLPILAILIILKQGISYYLHALRNILAIMVGLGVIVLLIDAANGTHTFKRYLDIAQNIASAMIIATAFIQRHTFNAPFYKRILPALVIGIGILVTMLHFYIFRIDTTIAFGFTMSMSEWAQKNYTFWYIFLTWGTLSFFRWHQSSHREKSLLVLLVFIASVAVFTGYSASAKVAFVAGMLVYILFHILPIGNMTVRILALVAGGYILFFPWLSDIFVLLKDLHRSLAGREGIFAIYPDIVKHNLLFGYGFNNTGSIRPSQCVSPEILTKYADNLFMKGCAPHSLPLLLWLNLGLIGMLPFSILVYKAVKRVLTITIGQPNQPALAAMIMSFVVIVTFSWGTWQPHALLTFAFFSGMILLSLNLNTATRIMRWS